jgi:hypothetical protein
MQGAVDPTLSMDRMLLGSRFAVNPETVADFKSAFA